MLLTVRSPEPWQELEREAREKAERWHGAGVDVECSPTRWGVWVTVCGQGGVVDEFEVEAS